MTDTTAHIAALRALAERVEREAAPETAWNFNATIPAVLHETLSAGTRRLMFLAWSGADNAEIRARLAARLRAEAMDLEAEIGQ